MLEKNSIWYYIKNYKFNSIFIKNFILIMIVVVLPLAGLSVLVYRYYNTIMKDEIAASNMNVLNKVGDMFDMIMRENDKLSVRIATDSRVLKYLSSSKPENINYGTLEEYKNIYNALGVSAITSDYISSTYLYSQKRGQIISSVESGMDLEEFCDNHWYHEYKSKKAHEKSWISVRKVSKNSSSDDYYNFITTFRMAPIYEKTKQGVVMINIDILRLNRLIGNVSSKHFENLYIADGKGRILYSNDFSFINRNIRDTGFIDGEIMSYEGPVIKKLDKIDGVLAVASSKLDEYDFKYVSLIPLVEYEKKTLKLRQFIAFFIGVSILFAMAIAFLVSTRIFKPVRNLITVLNDFDHAALSDGNANSDEFKYITANILNTLDKNRQMEDELVKRLKLLNESRTRALQSQISPHFLYNTLETINWTVLSLTKAENKATQLINSLSRLLSISLKTEENMVPFYTDIEHVKSYLEIQEVRYKDKFKVVWDIDPEIIMFKVIKIMLQPVIENSIYHGVKPKKGKGLIKIRGFTQDKHVIIEISDNGAGMTQEDVKKINDNMSKEYVRHSHHIGLRNVNQRIKLVFGEEFGITVQSAVNKGSVVKIVLPMVK